MPAAISTMLLALASCGGDGTGGVSVIPAPSVPDTGTGTAAGTGTLVVMVADSDGQPLRDASVSVFDRQQSKRIGVARSDAIGQVTFRDLPAEVRVGAVHDFGAMPDIEPASVAQPGDSSRLSLVLPPYRPRPAAALLPVEIPPGRVSADRSELLLKVTVVASPTAPFWRAEFGDGTPASTPALRLALGDTAVDGAAWQCYVWLDSKRVAPDCGKPSDPSSYSVSIESFAHDAAGMIPSLAAPGTARDVMLLLDQSERVAALDPHARRSFASRRFIERSFAIANRRLAIYGIAGHRTAPAARALLPQQPLWSPLAPADAFSADPAVVASTIRILEPLVGGGAPVLGALEAALATAASRPAPGQRAIVALLGGGDDEVATETARASALARLRRQRDASGIQVVLINAATRSQPAEQLALARLAATLRAPVIALGFRGFTADPGTTVFTAGQSWASGSYAALDLAGDLVDGVPLHALSATFRVRVDAPRKFEAGGTLQGTLFLESDFCPMGCAEIPFKFAVEIP